MKIEFENLTLRTFKMEDIDEVARMWNFEKGPISKMEAKTAIKWMHKNHKKNHVHHIHHLCFAIFEKNKNKIIGWCGLDGRNQKKVNLFYLIDTKNRKKGYATLCAENVLKYGFRKMILSRIDGECAAGNIASKKIMEKIGMRKESENPPHYYITLSDFRSLYD